MTTTTTNHHTKETTTMDTTTSILVSKIEKLWRKAGDAGATQAEREAFEAKALSLMEENRITMAMLEIDGEDILGDFEYGFIKGRYARVEIDVVSSIARSYDCRVWWRTLYGGSKQLYIFGFKSDAERVKLLAQMLVADAFAQAAKVKGYDAGETFSMRHSFVQGFSYEIGVRLREAARLASKAMGDEHGEAAKGAALVLVSRREQMHDEYSKKRLRSAAPTRSGSRSGFAKGQEAGRNASLSTQGKVARATRALAS